MTEAKNTPRDFFLYLFATVALYVSAVNVIALLWQYVNYFFPESTFGYFGGFSGPMRFAISTLIILFPAFVFVMRFLNRDIDRHPEKRELWIRRWLTYLTLFIAAAVIIGDLVALVNTFLGGDLAVRFGLKALSVLVVAAIVFWYYLFNLRRQPGQAVGTRNALVWISLVALVALIVGAFFIVGSPTTNRLRNQDMERVSHLQTIQSQVTYFWQKKQTLPENLTQLEDPLSGVVIPTDPVTGAAYEYNASGLLSFNLCATFALKSEGTTNGSMTKPVPVGGEFPAGLPASGGSGSAFGGETPTYWQHSAGKVCFTRTIDPQLYADPNALPFAKPIR